jgi:hypothetical protein
MKELMTKQFDKWISKQEIQNNELKNALNELELGNFDANLGTHLFKKRVRFIGKGKRSSGRTIICYKRDDRAIFIHGFAKKEKDNLSAKELLIFKELSKILLALSLTEIEIAIKNGDLVEVKS